MDGGHLNIRLDGTRIEVRLQGENESHTIRTDKLIQKDTWYHLAFSFGAGGMKLYVNGLLVGEEEYRKMLAGYKIRHIIPPLYWEMLPYTLDGYDFSTYAGANARFRRELTQAGVVVNVSYDVTLLADVLEKPLSSFRSTLQKLLFTLDIATLTRFVTDVNSVLRRS